MKVYLPYYKTFVNKKAPKKLNWKLKKLIKTIELIRKRNYNIKILDIGCSSSPIYYQIKPFLHKYDVYVGVDYNIVTVKNLKNKGLNIIEWDVSEKIPKELRNKKFHIVWMSHVIEHLNVEKQIIAIKNIQSLIHKGGYIFIFAPTPYHWYFWDDFTHVRPCTHGQLSKLLRNFEFEIIEAKYSLVRFFSNSFQRYLRLPPLRWFLWEVYVIGKKI